MLTSKQRQFLKAQTHKLKPVMHVGKGGVTPAQAAELDVMVDSLELVKVKINPNSFEDEDTAAKALCASVAGLAAKAPEGARLRILRIAPSN